MSDLYKEAITIDPGTKDDPRVPERHPATLEAAAKILDQLTPQQCCDAVYTDGLIHLHNPGRNGHIHVRDLLLGQAAMDAHDLAEPAPAFESAVEGYWCVEDSLSKTK